ncbi:hypothetical protein diail_10321 [Diaporthe ilicicola]|nr:hypothetical protein diail_10321 [Diaporthe ilicicola]
MFEQRQIGRFVDTLCHYSGVFDVLSQCAFGYMTLIWGSLKPNATPPTPQPACSGSLRCAPSLLAYIVSVFLLWARGMTARSAIASIVFQMVQQRPKVLQRAGPGIKSFSAANASLPKPWDLFCILVQHLGGLMAYISIGSVGQEEFGINFVHVEDCIDLDDKYDVHTSLATSDALYHVVLLELGAQESLSETKQLVLWEALWREVRHAVMGIAVTQTVEEIKTCARELVEERTCGEDVASLWVSTVTKWTKNNRSERADPATPERGGYPSAAPGADEAGEDELRQGDPKPLDDEERNAIWQRIQDAIQPATIDTYNASVRVLMRSELEGYLDDPPGRESDARRPVKELMRGVFGWNKTWKTEFLDEQGPILESMVTAIDRGFGDVLDAIIAEVGI